MVKNLVLIGILGVLAGCAGVPQKHAVITPTFLKHVVGTNIHALGADTGDRYANGMSDLIAAEPNQIVWYDPNGRRHLIATFSEPSLFIHLRTADIDGDGDIDALGADHRNGRIVYFENPGPAAKRNPWPQHVVDDKIKGAHAIALADINRDGRIDVVASGEGGAVPPNSIVWYAGPKAPNTAGLWPKYVIGPGQAGGESHYPAVGDANGDGRPDVVQAAKRGNWFRLWLQPEDPRQPWKLQQIAAEMEWATNIQVGDVNGDGEADLVATLGHAKGILWFEGPEWKPHFIDQTLKSPHTLVLADIDGDGDLDIATCAYESRVLAWFENDGHGNFRRDNVSLDQAAYDLVARDVDGDGHLDLVVAGQQSRNVVWYEQVPMPFKGR